MAEHNIMDVAGDFSINQYCAAPWICRDDNDDYWTVIRDTSDGLKIYKSIDDGSTWTLKKTLANSDFTGTPFPTDNFQIINLVGQDKVYVFFTGGVNKQKLFGWIFNVTADTNAIDLNNAQLVGDDVNERCHTAWDSVNNRLLIVTETASDLGFGKINLNGTSTFKGYADVPHILSYYISPVSGHGFLISEDSAGSRIKIYKKRNDADYDQDRITSSDISITISNLKFANIVTDSDGHPIIGYAYHVGDSNINVYFSKRDKDSLGTILSSGMINITIGIAVESCFMTIDGNNNLYFVFTKGSDKECYYVKYDGSAWGSITKISSDNDGQLAMPEVRVPITDNKILVTYQATA
jgi:hypothetical protein